MFFFHTIDKTLDILFVRNRDATSEKLFGRKSIDLKKKQNRFEKFQKLKIYSAEGQQTSS